jgi:hypothetical protein
MVRDTFGHAGDPAASAKATAVGVAGEGFRQTRKTLILTRALLGAGLIAGLLYIVVGLIQMLIRPGFDIRRHELSLMSNGDLGWIQIGNFVVTGLLVIAGAIGMRRVLRGSRGGTWGPLLVAVFGAGLIAAGAFVADPMNGFPPGAPAGSPGTISWHGLLHFMSGGVGFLALISACLVFARRFAVLRQRAWSAYSVATGVLFLAAFIGIAAGPHQEGVHLGFIDATFVNLGFTAAVILGWAWITAVAARLMTETSGARK